MTDPARTDDHIFGLACWSGPAHPMPRAHRHDDIEVNLVTSGQLDYLFGGRRVPVEAGVTSVFWAALPHQVVSTTEGSSASWLTVPLDVVLSWRLAEPQISPLLSGEPLLAVPAGSEAAAEPGQRFARWSADLAAADPQLTEIALLEMEAYLHRLLRTARPRQQPAEVDATASVQSRSRAATMARFLATRFREPVSVEEVAAAVHLHPHYAMQVFRDAVGTTLGSYLTQCRLAEAQRLLITTPLTVTSVAHVAGFGSTSRLYAACAAAGLPAPASYRRLHRDAAGRATHGRQPPQPESDGFSGDAARSPGTRPGSQVPRSET